MQTTAARLTSHGSPLEVSAVELPHPQGDEVAVEVAFAGINPIDRYTALGRVAADGPLPRTLGGEASGYVNGKPVVVFGSGLGATRDGVYANRAVVPADAVLELPKGFDLQVAACLGVAGMTAWNVTDLARIGPDDRVLVLGAGGGVGLPNISLSVARGAVVWGQVGSETKAESVRRAGAEKVVVTDASGLADAVRDYAPTVVLDPLGGEFVANLVPVVAPKARIVTFGTSAGVDVAFNLQTLYRNSISLLGYGGLTLTQAQRSRGVAAAIRAVEEGDLVIPVERTVPLADVNSAFDALADRRIAGKIILAL